MSDARRTSVDAPTCEASGCDRQVRYMSGGGAAARFYYCAEHARDLCACEAYWFAPGCTDDPGTALGELGAVHTRTACRSETWGLATRSAGTAGGSWMGGR